ncbi:MAG: hypothetical protein ACYC7H_07255 [Chloroflexota bacterium]
MRRWARGFAWAYDGTWLLILLGLGFFLAVYLFYANALLHFPFDYDQGEGYDVNSAWALSQGWPIYGSPDVYPYYSSNYPPLYSLLLAPLTALFGPRLALGRLLSLAAVGLATLVIGRAVHVETGRLRPALLAGLMFLASPYVYHTTPLARVNALMLALGLAGLYVVGRVADAESRHTGYQNGDRDKPRAGAGWLVLGGGLLLAALYTKQMALDAVGAAVLYLMLRDWRRGLALGGGVLTLGGAVYLGLDALTGGGFSLNVLWANANAFSADQAVAYYRNFLEVHLLLVAAGLAVTAFDLLRRGPRGLSVYSLYFLAGLGLALSTGKWGAGESYFLSAIAAGCILSGGAIGRLDRLWERLPGLLPGRLPLVAAAAALVVAIAVGGAAQLRLLWHGPWQWPEVGLYDRGVQASVIGHLPSGADTAAGLRVAAYLRDAPGEVLSEESAFALVAGRRVLGNATQQRNLFESGKHDPSALVAALASGEISVVVLNAQQYPAPVLAAIGQNCYGVETVEMNRFRYLVLLSGRR